MLNTQGLIIMMKKFALAALIACQVTPLQANYFTDFLNNASHSLNNASQSITQASQNFLQNFRPRFFVFHLDSVINTRDITTAQTQLNNQFPRYCDALSLLQGHTHSGFIAPKALEEVRQALVAVDATYPNLAAVHNNGNFLSVAITLSDELIKKLSIQTHFVHDNSITPATTGIEELDTICSQFSIYYIKRHRAITGLPTNTLTLFFVHKDHAIDCVFLANHLKTIEGIEIAEVDAISSIAIESMSNKHITFLFNRNVENPGSNGRSFSTQQDRVTYSRTAKAIQEKTSTVDERSTASPA